jgi:hypothetical protein
MILQSFKAWVLACTLITINFAGFSQNLEVASGGLLYLSPGAVVTAGGNFSNAGTVTLDASTTAYSQLKISGTASGNVVQSQYLEAWSHLLSSPVSQGFTTTSGDKEKLYSYDATAGNWAAIGANFATPGLGFAARVHATQIPFLTAAANVSVTGTPNTSMTHTLGYFALNSLAGGSGPGWNLIGNPYTCGLDWSSVLPLTNVNSAFYIWDPLTSSYVYYSTGGITNAVIPPMQAFWVQATQAGASISTTMATNGTVSSSPAYYKTIPDNLIVTVTKAGDSATTDRLWVANIQGTGDGFDGAYDAWKMTNGPTMPNVFTWDLGERIAINATEIDAAKVLPMGFSYAVAATKFGVSLEQVTGGQYYDVYLEDKLTGSYHDLNQSDYSFTHQGWTQEGPRFALHFSLSTVGVEEPNAADRFVAYQNQDRIVLRSSETGFSAYRLYGLNGQELSRGPLTPGMQSIAAPTSAGLYFIEAYGPQGTLRQKITIVY